MNSKQTPELINEYKVDIKIYEITDRTRFPYDLPYIRGLHGRSHEGSTLLPGVWPFKVYMSAEEFEEFQEWAFKKAGGWMKIIGQEIIRENIPETIRNPMYDGWTSVLEALPERGTKVRCLIKDEEGVKERTAHMLKRGGLWNIFHKNITHWRYIDKKPDTLQS